MLNTILNERYRIDAEIGQGGMGIVFRAHDLVLKRDVAVKELSNFKLGTEGKARLLAEAQTVAQLNHPNTVSVYDAGEHEGTPFIVMEYVEGQTLRDNMPETWDEILGVARQICSSLEHAHKHDVVHRDIKPENVVIDPDGNTKLMDFGIAHSLSSRITSDGMVIGTVFYMSPEQAMGKSVDARSDLYSLGVMLYEFTTGEVPFSDLDAIAVISQHINAPIVPPRAKRADIPPGLDALIVGLLEKDPDDRPASAVDVLKILNDPLFLDSGAVPARELSLLDRIVRGRMIGRKAELDQARALWKDASLGSGQSLLISGEPGIGKTRLVREIVTLVNVSRGQALTGACFGEGGAPYSAFGQIIRQYFAKNDMHTLDIPDSVMADLLTLVPDLQSRYLDIPPNPKLETYLEQERMFENIITFFRLLSQEVPLMVVLEDVHWAESGTLNLLLHLARNIKNDSIMLVANYREVELDVGHPFYKVLLDLNRGHLTTRIKLARLSRARTSDLLSSMFDEEITLDFLEGIYHETEGNPFFIEEVCKALIENGKLYFEDGEWHRPNIEDLEVPQSIRIAIQERIGKLNKEYQGTLNIAAVLGHEFDFEVLSAVSHQDEDTLIDSLEAAEKAQLVRADPHGDPNSFAFVHALIPSTLYQDINVLRRVRLHKRVAEAIQKVHPNEFEELAYHFTGAGDLENAVIYYQNAARRAQELFALDVAIQHLETALDLLEPDENVQIRIGMLENLADVIHIFGDDVKSISVYQEALELWQKDGSKDNFVAARIYHHILDNSNGTTSYDDFQHFEGTYKSIVGKSLQLVDTLAPDQITVNLLLALALHFWIQVQPQNLTESKRYTRAASEMAKNLDSPVLESATLGAQFIIYQAESNHRKWLEICRQRIEISKHPKFDDQNEMTDILMDMSMALVTVGDYDEAMIFIAQTQEHTEKIQDVFNQVLSMTVESMIWYKLDHWDEVINVYQKWRALEKRYPNFMKRAGPLCFQIALTSSVFTQRGENDKGIALRKESFAKMSSWSGPLENWGRGNYY